MLPEGSSEMSGDRGKPPCRPPPPSSASREPSESESESESESSSPVSESDESAWCHAGEAMGAPLASTSASSSSSAAARRSSSLRRRSLLLSVSVSSLLLVSLASRRRRPMGRPDRPTHASSASMRCVKARRSRRMRSTVCPCSWHSSFSAVCAEDNSLLSASTCSAAPATMWSAMLARVCCAPQASTEQVSSS